MCFFGCFWCLEERKKCLQKLGKEQNLAKVCPRFDECLGLFIAPGAFSKATALQEPPATKGPLSG